jgi:hypothetical protein
MLPKTIKSKRWVRLGVFTPPSSFAEFESCVNTIFEEKDRGDVFEIFIEGYLATQEIAQSRQHWVVGAIPLELRERYKLPSDGTGIDGIYEAHDGSHVAYQVKYRQKSNLTYQEVAPFLGLTEQFSDRVIFTNASTLAHQALPRTRWLLIAGGADGSAIYVNALTIRQVHTGAGRRMYYQELVDVGLEVWNQRQELPRSVRTQNEIDCATGERSQLSGVSFKTPMGYETPYFSSDTIIKKKAAEPLTSGAAVSE